MPATTKQEFEALARVFQEINEQAILGYDSKGFFTYNKERSGIITSRLSLNQLSFEVSEESLLEIFSHIKRDELAGYELKGLLPHRKPLETLAVRVDPFDSSSTFATLLDYSSSPLDSIVTKANLGRWYVLAINLPSQQGSNSRYFSNDGFSKLTSDLRYLELIR